MMYNIQDHYCPACKKFLYNGEYAPLIEGLCIHCHLLIKWDSSKQNYQLSGHDSSSRVDEDFDYSTLRRKK